MTDATQELIDSYRVELIARRERLRELYARFMEYGSRMRSKGLVQWNRERHCYYAEFLLDHSYKERETIKKLLALQKNISDQAMLLLELEHAIDREQLKP